MENLPLNTCPVCGDDSVEEINAKADAKLRNRSLTLSSVVTVMVLGSHVYFSWFGKTLIIPDIVWAIILGPWLGAAGGKLTDLLDTIKKKAK